ncbi:ATP-binding protein [Romboutsia sp.]|uniref:ATP-binding protein n=1 Tax=Romboutsia sp. TaxID=1965302 RepID=UPI003F2BCF9A
MLDSILFWFFINLISSGIEWGAFKCILDEFSEKKNSTVVINISIIILTFITTLLAISKIHPSIKLIIGIVMSLIVYLYNYNEKLLKTILVLLMFWMIILGSDILSTSIISFVHSISDINRLLDYSIFRLELIITSKLLLIAMVPLVKGIKIQLELKLKEFINIIIPIVANIISIAVIFGSEFGVFEDYKLNNLILLVSAILLLISNISLINMVGNLIKKYNLKAENEIIKQKIEAQYEHYKELQNAQLKVRKLYHDMSNHIICIEKMIDNNQYSKHYIDSIKSELNQWDSISTTGNMILDIILSEKKDICKKKSIKFSTDINFKECDFVDMIDVCSIFSNILDNSIEACNKIENENNRYIKIVGNIVNKFYVIRCENSKINEIKKKSNKIISDKRDKYMHGLGVSSVNSSVKKYDGTMATDYTEDKFIVNIYIPLEYKTIHV